MPLPSLTVTGNVFDILADGTELAGIAALDVAIKLTSNVPAGRFVTWDGDLYRVPVVHAAVKSDGSIVLGTPIRGGVIATNDPVRLLANDPGLSVQDVQWTVEFYSVSAPQGHPRLKFVIDGEDGATIDLATVTPAPGMSVSPTPVLADVDDLTDATAMGKLLVRAVSGEAARTAIGLETIVPIEDYDPDVNYAAALSAAIDAASAVGGTVVHAAGKTYTANAGVAKTDVAARIDWNGARVVRAAGMADAPLLRLTYTTSTPQSVVALTDQSYTWPGSSDSTPVTRIEVASTTGWAAGDWAVLVGDDAIPYADPTKNQRQGERVRIAAVSGSYLYLARRLRVTLTTAVRIARMTVREVVLTEPWVEDAAGSPGTRSEAAIDIIGAVQPRLTVPRARNLLTTGVKLWGCVGGTIDGSDMYNLKTTEDVSYGYGVNLMSCCDFKIRAVNGSFLRHLITTGAKWNVSAGAATLHHFGANIGHHIAGGSAGEVGNAAFDTHPDAAYITYDSCFVGWPHREPLGAAQGFNVRGLGCIIKDCTSFGAIAAELRAYGSGGEHKLLNHTHTVPAGSVLSGPIIHLNCGDRASRGQGELSGRVYAPGVVPESQYTPLVRCTKSTARIPDLSLTVSPGGANPLRLIGGYDSEIAIGTLTVDVRGGTAETRVFFVTDATSMIKVDRLIVLAAGAPWRIADFNGAAGKLAIGRIDYDTPPAGTGVASADSATWSIDGAPLWESGSYYFCNSPNASSTSATLTANRARTSQWQVERPLPVAALVAEFTAAGDAASVLRVGIWADNGAGKPGALLLDAGTISTGTGNAGTVATGGTPGAYEIPVSVTLPPGVYHVGGVVQGVSSTQPTIRTVGGAAVPMDAPMGTTVAALAGGTPGMGWYKDGFSGALGAITAPTRNSSSSTTAPRIGFKVAA